jgi:flagellin
MPLITANQNVKFNGVLENAVVLKNSGGFKTLILSDDLSAADLATLTAFVNSLGGDAPLAAPVAGTATARFPAATVGGTATGLSAVAAATAGIATVNLGGTAIAGNASGLSSAVGTAGSQRVNLEPGKVGANATGLANNATTYTATITVDGVARPISIVGSAAQTFTTLLAELNTDLGPTAVATLSGGDLKVESVTFGTASRVRIVDGTLFAALTGFVAVLPPQDGDSTGRTYSAVVEVDGALKSVQFAGTAGALFSDVVTQVNADLGGAATAAISGGNLVITSATTGRASKVRVFDAGLFAALTGFVGTSFVDGVAPTVYTATITVDGVARAIAVQGSAAQTFTTLLAEINTDLAASATAALSGGSIVVTSATTGAASSVVIADGTLFKAVAGFAGLAAPVAGAADMVDAMKLRKVGATSLFDLFDVKVVGAKPAVPPVPAVLPKTPQFTYFDGTVWKYLADDTDVNP